jgi:hypothetical protein
MLEAPGLVGAIFLFVMTRHEPHVGYSGWVFANQLGGTGDIFDTILTFSNFSAGGMTLQGRLFGSDGTSDDPYNENYATWESYTLMKPNVEVGTFNFSGASSVTAVPEPSSMIVLSIVGVGGVVARYQRRNKKSIVTA